MRSFAATKGKAGHSWRFAMAFLTLLAFTTQSLLIQTHFHLYGMNGGAPVAGTHTPKAPFDGDKCLLCQEFVHSGTYLSPAAVAILPPSAAVSLQPLALLPLVLGRATSHNWIGRAPPQA